MQHIYLVRPKGSHCELFTTREDAQKSINITTQNLDKDDPRNGLEIVCMFVNNGSTHL